MSKVSNDSYYFFVGWCKNDNRYELYTSFQIDALKAQDSRYHIIYGTNEPSENHWAFTPIRHNEESFAIANFPHGTC